MSTIGLSCHEVDAFAEKRGFRRMPALTQSGDRRVPSMGLKFGASSAPAVLYFRRKKQLPFFVNVY
jgi:hypothetical protein